VSCFGVAWPVTVAGADCSGRGVEWCIPCLREPVEVDGVYETRDGCIVRIVAPHPSLLDDRFIGVFETRSASGSNWFGPFGSFDAQRRSSPSDLVRRIS
jgi:hypothetical protein